VKTIPAAHNRNSKESYQSVLLLRIKARLPWCLWARQCEGLRIAVVIVQCGLVRPVINRSHLR